jgi:glutamate synthase (NADPH/NADH) small chain
VFERDDRIGGLLRYGIPDFKLEKHLIDRRVDQLRAEGVEFRVGVEVGVHVTGEELRASFDAVLLAGGARVPRDLPVPGRGLGGVHFAMEFLEQANRKVAGDEVPGQIVATGRRVVVIGGGDTGSDCIGTSNRQGAASILQLELMPRPPEARAAHNPWPAWPLVLRTSSSHEEGAARDWAVMTTALLGDERGHVRALRAVRVRAAAGRFEPIPGTEQELPCELVLLAMGFTGSAPGGIFEQLGLSLDARANVPNQAGRTSVSGVFVAGDMSRGQSLVVWAIAEGRNVASEIDSFLAPRRRLAIAG